MSACVNQCCLWYSPENIRKAIDFYVFRGMKRETQLEMGYTYVCASGVRNARFSENLVCFVFLSNLFWDSPFCLITGAFKEQCSPLAEKSQLICRTNLYLVMIYNLTVSNCTADKSVTVSWKINQTFPDDVNKVTYLEDYQKRGIYCEFDKVSNAFSLKTFSNTRCRQKHAQIR